MAVDIHKKKNSLIVYLLLGNKTDRKIISFFVFQNSIVTDSFLTGFHF